MFGIHFHNWKEGYANGNLVRHCTRCGRWEHAWMGIEELYWDEIDPPPSDVKVLTPAENWAEVRRERSKRVYGH
jgi:hypothetical protein